MNFKFILFAFAFTCIHITLTLATSKRRKNEDETSGNSLHHSPSDISHRATLLTSLMQDPTVPVFIVMGLASIASALSRSPASGWTSNLLKFLGNVQKAVEKYQQLEEEIVNELDEEMSKRDFGSKSLD
ncbi:hypothetical protein B4U79_06887 [Dinothrombium tinctorium]|uniref:Uncharacterized protein n=1 Tax=Dinothrombium tinctorium TaxID=1965070 RepID=A0A3S3PVX6_9ACAR|nr:hypothetical protein B4U79_13693 [Dinothrombium tinctorium]RWS09112.1 hypothetical protein B4U79_06887 [Dinothrombium tinctorium]